MLKLTLQFIVKTYQGLLRQFGRQIQHNRAVHRAISHAVDHPLFSPWLSLKGEVPSLPRHRMYRSIFGIFNSFTNTLAERRVRTDNRG